MKVFYFGCWNRAGHYLFGPGGQSVRDDRAVVYYRQDADGDRVHLDATLAPRRFNKCYRESYGHLCWQGQGATRDDRLRIGYDSDEYEQGQFLRHVLPNGFTAISWWDRCQGDQRGACNSTVLVEGERTTEEMLAVLREHFPSVLANLDKHGVSLVEVTP